MSSGSATLPPTGAEVFQMDFRIREGSGRKIWGLVSTPDLDRQLEIVETSALQEALGFFMRHPIIHLYHTKRPIGVVTKAWFEGSDLYVEGEIWEDESADDVWDAILKGVLSQWSIKGRARERSGPCAVPAAARTAPCVTRRLWLDSISLCPAGTAVNRRTFAEVVKAMASNSALVHATPDGVRCPGPKKHDKTEIEKMVDKPTEAPQTAPPGETEPTAADLLKERLVGIETRIGGIETRLDAVEEALKQGQAEQTEKAEPANPLDDTPNSPPDREKGKDIEKALADRLATLEAKEAELRKAIITARKPVIVTDDLEKADKEALGPAANVRAFARF